MQKKHITIGRILFAAALVFQALLVVESLFLLDGGRHRIVYLPAAVVNLVLLTLLYRRAQARVRIAVVLFFGFMTPLLFSAISSSLSKSFWPILGDPAYRISK